MSTTCATRPARHVSRPRMGPWADGWRARSLEGSRVPCQACRQRLPVGCGRSRRGPPRFAGPSAEGRDRFELDRWMKVSRGGPPLSSARASGRPQCISSLSRCLLAARTTLSEKPGPLLRQAWPHGIVSNGNAPLLTPSEISGHP
eukprot:scaffold7387_cov408-Prasinococcus_capsulatus_cf.AAC.1